MLVYGSWSSQAAAAISTRSIAALTRRHHAGRERIAPCSKRGMMYKEGEDAAAASWGVFESTPFVPCDEGARVFLLAGPSTRGEAFEPSDFAASSSASAPPLGLGSVSCSSSLTWLDLTV